MTKDQIEKSVLLQFSKDDVWRALSHSNEFGSWFGIKFEGPFSRNSSANGQIVPTTVDPLIAKMQEPYAGKRVEFFVEEIQPKEMFSFRWHLRQTMAVGLNRWS